MVSRDTRPKLKMPKLTYTTPIAKRNGFEIAAPGSSSAISIYAIDRNIPKKKPPNALPTTIVVNEIGAASSLSKVPLALSKGNAIDSIAPAPNSDDIATSPGMIKEVSAVLPTEKAI